MSASILAPFGLNPAAQQSNDPLILPTPQFVSGTLDIAGANPIYASGIVHTWDDVLQDQDQATCQATAGINDTATTLTVDEGSASQRVLSFQVGDIVKTANNEHILITAVTASYLTPGAATWTVVRGYQQTSPALIPTDSVLTRQYSTVAGDAAEYPPPALDFLSTASAATTNYFQTIARELTITRDAMRLRGYNETIVPQMSRMLMDMVLRDLERAITLGVIRDDVDPQGISHQGAVMKGWQPLAPAPGSPPEVTDAATLWEFLEGAYDVNRASNLLIAGKTAARLLRSYLTADDLYYPSARGGCTCSGGRMMPSSNGPMNGAGLINGNGAINAPGGLIKSLAVGILQTQYAPWNFIVNPHIDAEALYTMSTEDLRLVIAEPLATRRRETTDVGLTIAVGGTFTLRYGNPATWTYGTAPASA